jgi:hypothetical protein
MSRPLPFTSFPLIIHCSLNIQNDTDCAIGSITKQPTNKYGVIKTSIARINLRTALSKLFSFASSKGKTGIQLGNALLLLPSDFHKRNSGTRQRSWLRHYATSWKIADLICVEVIPFFI